MTNNAKILGAIVRFTCLFIFAQVVFFFVHYRLATILDALAGTSIEAHWSQPEILWPVIGFIGVQVIAYALFVTWIWFVAISVGELLELSARGTYWLGLFVWMVAVAAVFTLNHYFYPHSFFANAMDAYVSPGLTNDYLLPMLSTIFCLLTLFAYVNFFYCRRFRAAGWVVLALLIGVSVNALRHQQAPARIVQVSAQPNIIIIGLDSLRPDHVSYFGSQSIRTEHLDAFLKGSVVFTEAYSPLARTFPAWMSVLTGKFPLNNHARMNLQDPTTFIEQANLAKTLKAHGYYTIYGSDEVRFSDISTQYGFDRLIRPKGGAAGFVIEGAQDFPLTNLLMKIPGSRHLFPYNYANRGAPITYQPEQFLDYIAEGLHDRPQQPLFLALHFCLSHWPFIWADDPLNKADGRLDQLYAHSVMALDKQFAGLMSLLTASGLLENSIVIVMSDHGVTLGLPDDRLTRLENYQGDERKRRLRSVMKLNTAPELSLNVKKDFVLHTTYGQGTDVLSLKQNHVVLAWRGYGVTMPPHHVNGLSSLIDIAPTVLAVLQLPPMAKMDGRSLRSSLFSSHTPPLMPRPFYIETADKYEEMERRDIDTVKLLSEGVNAYELHEGHLLMKPAVSEAMIKAKQRAVLSGEWMLARYPAEHVLALEGKTFKPMKQPAYDVLANIKSGKWTTDMSSSFAKSSPLSRLQQQLRAFYGNEV